MPKPPKDLALGHLDDGDDDNDEQPRRRPSGAPEFDMMRRASKSFENLVALANDQERLNAMSKVARKAVWRDVGEPPVQLETFLECLEHASRGGLRESSFCLLGTQPPELLGGYRIERNTYTVQWPGQFFGWLVRVPLLGAAILAGTIRSGVNIFLLIFRIIRAPRYVSLTHVHRPCSNTEFLLFCAPLIFA